MVLSDCKQLTILTELSTNNYSFKIELCNCEVSFQVENDCKTRFVDGNQNNSIGRYDQVTDLMRSLKG